MVSEVACTRIPFSKILLGIYNTPLGLALQESFLWVFPAAPQVHVSFCELGTECHTPLSQEKLLEIDIVMSSSLFMVITYYSVMTDTNERD